MYLKNITDSFKTVTFRLTLWYTILFSILSLAVFTIVYVSLTWHLLAQEDNELLATAKEFSSLYDERGIRALQAEFQREAKSRGIRQVFFSLLSSKGKVLASSDMKHWAGGVISTAGVDVSERRPVFRTIPLPGRHYKARIIFMPTRDGKLLELGLSLQDRNRTMKRYGETFGITLVIMLLWGSMLGWFLTRKAMAGVQRVTQTAIQIKEGNLASRVSPGGEGLEIDNLAMTFNEMLDRIETLVKELKEVTDNIAHDLRSPVTRIRGIAETTLTGESDLQSYKDMTARIIEESDRLVGLINTMLEITKTEAGVAEIARKEVNIKEIVRDAIDLFRPLSEDKHIHMESNIPLHPVVLQGDRTKLQRVVANLLDNAIKYTPPGGEIKISLVNDNRIVRLEIADTGIGMSKEDLVRIFDRFYRCDKSRSTPGSGLGLSLARAIVRAHGGDITVESMPGKGSKFTVILPYGTLQEKPSL